MPFLPLISIFVGSLALSATIIRLSITFADKLELLHSPTHRHHKHTRATPLVGGIGIFSVILFLGLFTIGPGNQFNGYVLIGAALLFFIGMLDDIRHVSPSIRLIFQIVAATLLVSGNQTEVESLGKLIFDQEILLNSWAIPFTIFAIVGVINAFNMIDGINGLAGTLALIPMLCIAALTPDWNHPLTITALIISGAITGFLIFNLGLLGQQRIVFLGDAGSTLLGYLVSWLIIEAVQTPSYELTPMGGLFLVALPVVDAIAVMTRRAMLGRSPFLADKKHLHHIVMLSGKSPIFTYVIMSLSALILAVLGIYHQHLNINDTVLLILFLMLFLVLHLVIKNATLKINRN